MQGQLTSGHPEAAGPGWDRCPAFQSSARAASSWAGDSAALFPHIWEGEPFSLALVWLWWPFWGCRGSQPPVSEAVGLALTRPPTAQSQGLASFSAHCLSPEIRGPLLNSSGHLNPPLSQAVVISLAFVPEPLCCPHKELISQSKQPACQAQGLPARLERVLCCVKRRA